MTRLNNYHLYLRGSHNQTLSRKVEQEQIVLLSGWMECNSPGPYEDQYDNYPNIIVRAILEITMSVQRAKVLIKNDKIYLESGIMCEFSSGHCSDSNFGLSYWETTSNCTCKEKENYCIIYKEPAEVITSGKKIFFLSSRGKRNFRNM